MDMPLKTQADDIGKLLLRMTVGGLMLFHGVSKVIHGVDWLVGMLGQAGLSGFVAYGVYLGEVIGPLLVIIGLRTRLAALLIAIDMIAAVALVQSGLVFSVSEMGGGWGIELEAFFFLGALALFFTGGGKYSVARGTWD